MHPITQYLIGLVIGNINPMDYFAVGMLDYDMPALGQSFNLRKQARTTHSLLGLVTHMSRNEHTHNIIHTYHYIMMINVQQPDNVNCITRISMQSTVILQTFVSILNKQTRELK